MVYLICISWLLNSLIHYMSLHLGRKGTALISLFVIILPSPLISWFLYYQLPTASDLLMVKSGLEVEFIILEEWRLPLYFHTNDFILLFVSMLTTISFVIHCYVYWYLYEDLSRTKFISILSFFTFSMSFFVFAGDLISIFIGWELIGISSFYLISYYNTQSDAIKSGLKAISYNRIGDICFLAYLCMELSIYEDSILCTLYTPALDRVVLSNWVTPFFLLIAAWVKSAQFGASPWLLCAMAGPTPVSALLHSATLVTAGVVLLLKCKDKWIYNESIVLFIFVLGVVTALLSSIAAVFFLDIKRMIAYSTCTHIGIIFMSLGLAAYNKDQQFNASIFHLFTHGWNKSLLFLLCGIMIHLLHVQDIRKFKNAYLLMPYLFTVSLISSLSIFGMPGSPLSITKESILEMGLVSWNVNIFWFIFVLISLSQGYSLAIIGRLWLQNREGYISSFKVGSSKNLWLFTLSIPLSFLMGIVILNPFERFMVSKVNSVQGVSYNELLPISFTIILALFTVFIVLADQFSFVIGSNKESQTSNFLSYFSGVKNWNVIMSNKIIQLTLNRWFVDKIFSNLALYFSLGAFKSSMAVIETGYIFHLMNPLLFVLIRKPTLTGFLPLTWSVFPFLVLFFLITGVM